MFRTSDHSLSCRLPAAIATTYWGIESIQHPVWPTRMLNTQFSHLGMNTRSHARGVRESQGWSVFLQQTYTCGHFLLLLRGKALPPRPKLIGVFYRPFH